MKTRNFMAHIVAAVLLIAATTAQAVPESIVARIDAAVQEGEALSVAVAYRRAGSTEHHFVGERALGSNDSPNAQTAYAIGSITKPFTHLLLAERVAAGQMNYGTTLDELLGDRIEFANPAVGSITLEQLATHTSGLPRLPFNMQPSNSQDPYADYDAEAMKRGLEQTRDKQPLGTAYAYSNFGAGALGWLLGEQSGTGYGAALRAEVLAPLGLDATGLVPGNNAAQAFLNGQAVPSWTFDAMAGAGALWSTTGDLMRLAEVLLGERENPLEHALSGDFEPVADAGDFRVTRVWHVAATPEGPLYWHNGGTAGHRSFFAVRPATEEALAILAAGDFRPTGPGLALFDFEPRAAQPAEIDADILGAYRLGEQTGRVFERDGVLMTQLDGQRALELTPVGDDAYRLNEVDASLRVVREGDDVVALDLIQNGAVQRAERIADAATNPERKVEALEDEALDAYVGEYMLAPGAKFSVRRGGESGLEVQLTGQPFFPVYPSGNDVFFYKIVDAELHFERDDEGRIGAVVLHQGGIQQRAERVE